jgi:hypothetical protein
MSGVLGAGIIPATEVKMEGFLLKWSGFLQGTDIIFVHRGSETVVKIDVKGPTDVIDICDRAGVPAKDYRVVLNVDNAVTDFHVGTVSHTEGTIKCI